MVHPQIPAQSMRHAKSKSGLHLVDPQAKNGFEEKGTNQEKTQCDKKAFLAHNAPLEGHVIHFAQEGMRFHQFGIDDQTNDRDDHSQAQQVHHAIEQHSR